ncbi:MAG: YqgE/AlgH family protein [Bacteroidales bacterium]
MVDIDKLLSLKIDTLAPKAGRLLISEPFLQDMFFKRSVVLLADHNKDGSFGLILNKPVEMKFNEIVQNFPHFEVPLYMGGPVKTDSVFFIHSLGDQIKNSYPIIPGLYWGGDIEDVKQMIREKALGKYQIKFFLGYSGWSENQLNEELERNSWVITDTRSKEVLEKPAESMWQKMVKSLGKEFDIWTKLPHDPRLN